MTYEVDFSGMHLNMIYALEKIELPDDYDPYTLDGYAGNKALRKLVKKILLRIINADSKDSVLASVKKDKDAKEVDLPGEIGTFDRLLELIEEKHKVVSEKYFYKDQGKHLQYHDAELANKIMMSYAGRGEAILPVHDSFIVVNEGITKLKDIM